MRKVLMLAALALVAGCDQPKQRDGQAAPAPAPVAAAAPALPAWAEGLMGQSVATAFPGTFDCKAFVDGATERSPERVNIVGWSWIPAAGAGAGQIIVADPSGRIVGFGQGGIARPDVPAALKDVTRPDVGFQASSTVTSGKVAVFGVDAAAKTACKLGEATL
ncbi:hypothetical protein [Phenylobacterium sp.]|jgi:hypothetical protein|uniref:hypothetical protein n=1 Tax=Phenylobacterium sp. TaxID=1871053 RepID=UPI002F93E073